MKLFFICISILLSQVLFYVPILVFAQTEIEHIDLPCVTPMLQDEEKSALEKLMLEVLQKKGIANKSGKIKNTGTTCIPIKIHDITNGSGGGALNMDKLNKDLANMNLQFKAANLEFYFCGTVSTLDNATFYEFDNANQNALIAAEPMVTNAFNVYFANSIQFNGGGAAGYAYYPANNLLSTFCMMDKNVIASTIGGTLMHEFGHHFNLHHTHQGTSNGNTDPNAENVPRTGPDANCTTRGDLVCDTHADPRGPASGCTYTGTGTDVLGNPYTPPLDNIMSYYSHTCRNQFTSDQISRVIAAHTIRQGHTAYSLNCAPAAVNLPSGLVAVQSGYGISLSWTDNATNEMGYLIERSTVSSSSGFLAVPMGGVAANITNFTDNSVAANTSYWYRIKPSNGNCNSYSNVASITTGLLYCTPTYYEPFACQNSTIARVVFNGNTTIDNTTACTPPPFTVYTGVHNAEVTAGVSYNFSIHKALNFNRYLQIYIDFNRDGDFDDVGEKILPDNTVAPSIYNGSVTIPASAINGLTTMRIIMKNQSTITSACETNMTYGESEDYGLIVIGGVSLDKKQDSFIAESNADILLSGMEIYPNPVQDNLIISYFSATTGYITIEVLDLCGKNIVGFRFDKIEGENMHETNWSTLNNGMYILKIREEGEIKTFKVYKR